MSRDGGGCLYHRRPMLCVPPGDASIRRLNRAWWPHATPLEGGLDSGAVDGEAPSQLLDRLANSVGRRKFVGLARAEPNLDLSRGGPLARSWRRCGLD